MDIVSMEYKEYVDKCIAALKSEIAFLCKMGRKKISIVDGKEIEDCVYSFVTDKELFLPNESPISITVEDNVLKGSVIACEGFSIVLHVEHSIGEHIPHAGLLAEPWRILDELCKRLDTTKENANKIAIDLACNGKDYANKGKLKLGQEIALESALSNKITIIWGPPGTGKTHILAQIAIAHLNKKRSVLIVSHSNVSVDGAILKVNELSDGKMANGEIIRCGHPRDLTLMNHPSLTSFNFALNKNPLLADKRKRLQAELKSLAGIKDQRYLNIQQELTKIRNELKQEEENIIKKAKMVATTISKVTMDGLLCESNFDVVLFDEVSMAYIPQVIFAASLAKKHFCCFGDYCQLPPIVQINNNPDAKEFLSQDIFGHLDIPEAVNVKKGHEWLALLDVQRRMHPIIAEFVNENMYHGLIKSDKERTQHPEIVKAEPLKNEVMGMININDMMSVCMQDSDRSHFNILSAFITLKIALIENKKNIGIITPYNAQSRLLNAMIRDIKNLLETDITITAATVHQFQGSEKDIILFDVTDCYRIGRPAYLLTSMENNQANRLINVAVTRSRGKFILIGNENYLKRKIKDENLIFPRLLEYLHTNGSECYGEELLNILQKKREDFFSFWPNDKHQSQYIKDLSEAKNEIRIDIPNNMNSDDPLLLTLEKAKKRGVSLIICAENKNALPHKLRDIAVEDLFSINPITVIDQEIIWFGHPASNANFILANNKILYTKYRPTIRFVGKNTAKLIAALRYNRYDKNSQALKGLAKFINENVKCKQCGSPILLKKNKKGIFYFACSAGKGCKPEYVDRNIVQKYIDTNKIRCKEDGTELCVKLGKCGVFICCGRPKESNHIYNLDQI